MHLTYTRVRSVGVSMRRKTTALDKYLGSCKWVLALRSLQDRQRLTGKSLRFDDAVACTRLLDKSPPWRRGSRGSSMLMTRPGCRGGALALGGGGGKTTEKARSGTVCGHPPRGRAGPSIITRDEPDEIRQMSPGSRRVPPVDTTDFNDGVIFHDLGHI